MISMFMANNRQPIISYLYLTVAIALTVFVTETSRMYIFKVKAVSANSVVIRPRGLLRSTCNAGFPISFLQ